MMVPLRGVDLRSATRVSYVGEGTKNMYMYVYVIYMYICMCVCVYTYTHIYTII